MIEFDDSNEDCIANYLRAYDEVKALEAEMAAAKEVKSAAEQELLGYLSGDGLDSVGRGGRSLSWSIRTFGRIVDYDAARGWVYEQDEPVSEYMEEAFKKKVVNEIAREAQAEAAKTGKSVEDCLPVGFGCYVKDVITVRVSKRKEHTSDLHTNTKLEQLDALMEGR